MNESKIKATIILDVVGKPPEHLIEALNNVIGEIEKEKGISIISKNIKEPTPMKDQEDFFTTFSELEIEADEVIGLAILLFKYMPAHIEISSPDMIVLSNSNWNDILNEIIRRLHAYDEVARVVQIDNQILKKKIEELTGKPISEAMAKKPKEPEKKKRQLRKVKRNNRLHK